MVVRDLTVAIAAGGAPVVADISFSVPAGVTLGLVGESGCGKSTVAVALLGIARTGLRITSGSVHIGGVDMLALSEKERRRRRGSLASYVPQDPDLSLNPARRVGWQLREALAVHHQRDIDRRVDQLLADVRLPATKKLLRSYPHQLSGGEQQRIVLAIAFACRPPLIVLDEPATGLDVTTQRQVLETIGELTQTYSCSAVYVTHDLAAVAQVAQVTAVMYAGRIVESAPSPALFSQPRHPYTSALLAGVPAPGTSRRLVGIEGRPPRPGNWPPGCAFAPRCPRVTAQCTASLVPLRGGDHAAVRCIHPLDAHDFRDIVRSAAPRPPRSSGDTLTVRALTARYGTAEVLHGVSLDVTPGTATAVVGESGCGKTTLARCIVGLHSSFSGDIRLGHEQLNPAAAARTTDELRRNPVRLPESLRIAQSEDDRGRERGRAAASLRTAVRDATARPSACGP